MKLKSSLALAAMSVASWAAPGSAQERLFVDITEGEAAPLTIGVPDTRSGVPLTLAEGADAGTALAAILRSDLGTSPFFRVVPDQSAAVADNQTLLRQFSARGTQALVIGRASLSADGSLVYDCAFYDVFSGLAEVERQFRVSAKEWRRAAHKCADLVVGHATGYPGHFDTRFALVAARVGVTAPAMRVIAVDVDGANPVELADQDELVTMPRFSPDNLSVLFVGYSDDLPTLVLSDLQTGRRTQLQLPAGLPSSARFSPDGKRVVLALSRDGNTDIFEYELATGRTVQLTNTSGIDTNPAYSPDGTAIVFESDRSGQQQLYIMRRDGSDQRRISVGAPHASPAWSPDGKLIAFASHTPTGSRIGVMDADGKKRRMLTEGPHDEDPTWASSGRAIAYQRSAADGDAPRLWVADLSGRRQFSVPLPVAASEPDWSEVRP